MQDRADKTTEAEAAKIGLSGNAFQRARMGVEAIRDLFEDPSDTTRVFVLGLAVSRRAYPELLARITLDDRGARLLRERPSIDTAHVDFDRLRALPETTLGGAYARYLDRNRLDPDLFQPPPGLPEVPSYITQRMRQVHDLWHVLTGYDTDVPGEIALQAFTWAQTDAPSSAMLTVAGLVRFGREHPKLFRRVVDAYRRGRRAEFLAPLWLEEMWDRSLDDVRRELGIEPATVH